MTHDTCRMGITRGHAMHNSAAEPDHRTLQLAMLNASANDACLLTGASSNHGVMYSAGLEAVVKRPHRKLACETHQTLASQPHQREMPGSSPHQIQEPGSRAMHSSGAPQRLAIQGDVGDGVRSPTFCLQLPRFASPEAAVMVRSWLAGKDPAGTVSAPHLPPWERTGAPLYMPHAQVGSSCANAC
jgi:hypothetical protein